MSVEYTKEKFEWHNYAFECKLKSTYGIENQNDMMRIYNNKVNNIAEWNSLLDIINIPKHIKI